MPTVGVSRVAAWNVKAVVGVSRSVRSDVRTPVGKTRQAVWNVASILASVGVSRAAVWNVRVPVGVSRLASWQALAGAASAAVYVARANAFDRVMVDFMAAGTARVTWTLSPHFIETLPYTFQLQVGLTGLADAGDWVDVGSPVVDAFVQTDATRRWYGKTQTPHYRVRMTTAVGHVYYSRPADVLGNLGWRDWHLAQEVVRKERLRHRWLTSVDGYLLKQRRGGARCPRCLDVLTDRSKDSRCPVCYGTGYNGGYFTPLPLAYADLSTERSREHLAQTGMAKEVVVPARFVAAPQLYARDVWVNRTADARYEVHSVGVDAQVRGVPVVVTAELRLLPPSDVIYSFPVA